jgi:hypothetical protein
MFLNLRQAVIQEKIHFFILSLLLIGIVSSKFFMSLGMMLGGLNLLLVADFKGYFVNLKKNRFFIFILLFYLIHLLGMFWTDDTAHGFDDLRVKASLIAIPLIICSKRMLNLTTIKNLFLLFILTLTVTSIYNIIIYSFFRENFELNDIRDLSRFGSHIRYGILIAIGIPVLVELKSYYPKWKYLFLLVGLWFLFYSYYSQVLSGIISVLIVVFGTILWKLFNAKKYFWGLGIISIFLVLICSAILYLMIPIKLSKIAPANNVSLKEEWNKRSLIPFDSLDLRKQKLSSTLERYLHSKNLPVRGDGVLKLSSKDIHNIELGYADINETKSGLMARLYGVRFQIHNASNPNGHSILERIEYWKTGWQVIKENWVFGVGTGDKKNAMEKMYEIKNSKLLPERRLRAHNSYITFCLTFGLFGLLFFCYILFNFLLFQLKNKSLIGFLFICVSIITFIFEDSLETQMGVSFFAFFFALFSRKIQTEELNT